MWVVSLCFRNGHEIRCRMNVAIRWFSTTRGDENVATVEDRASGQNQKYPIVRHDLTTHDHALEISGATYQDSTWLFDFKYDAPPRKANRLQVYQSRIRFLILALAPTLSKVGRTQKRVLAMPPLNVRLFYRLCPLSLFSSIKNDLPRPRLIKL